jgi:hypothetical protein
MLYVPVYGSIAVERILPAIISQATTSSQKREASRDRPCCRLCVFLRILDHPPRAVRVHREGDLLGVSTGRFVKSRQQTGSTSFFGEVSSTRRAFSETARGHCGVT